MTAERQELHQLIDDLDEENVRAVLELVRSHTDETKAGPRSAGNAAEWLAGATDGRQPRISRAAAAAGVRPLASVADLHQSPMPLTDSERAALADFLDS